MLQIWVRSSSVAITCRKRLDLEYRKGNPEEDYYEISEHTAQKYKCAANRTLIKKNCLQLPERGVKQRSWSGRRKPST